MIITISLFPFSHTGLSMTMAVFRSLVPEKALSDALYSVRSVSSVRGLRALLFDDLRIDEKVFSLWLIGNLGIKRENSLH